MKEERKKILEMVKTGQVSIEEAEKLLEELENMESLKEEKKRKWLKNYQKLKHTNPVMNKMRRRLFIIQVLQKHQRLPRKQKTHCSICLKEQ